ncbi:hypothetical protein MVEN_00889400 [Mycena venus]|uniref:Uncharacterized protein n=1 Tax=Mycena venus TaxID=2733690 RepID=A0A8H7D4F3_9AGAR|nr:hypothetical protein MVEN_00889400 [Mycena venus]
MSCLFRRRICYCNEIIAHCHCAPIKRESCVAKPHSHSHSHPDPFHSFSLPLLLISFIMFFSASIAFGFLVSLSEIAVHSAPLTTRDGGRQVCSGLGGTGICAPLPDGCTNVNDVGSLVLSAQDDCVGFPLQGCSVIGTTEPALELFLGNADDLMGDQINSIFCPSAAELNQ